MIPQSSNTAEIKGPQAPWTEPILLSISHLTRYTYEGAVQDSFNEARLQPITDTLQ
jgi:hypothetical protein